MGHVDGDLFIILLFSTIMLIGFPIARAIAKRILASIERGGGPIPPDIGTRLDRIEQITEATQIEVERLAEGQRFTAKLLSERPPVVDPVRVAAPSSVSSHNR